MSSQIVLIRYGDKVPQGYKLIESTSRGKDLYKNLSPFLIKNVYCYKDLYAKNVENAWQFSKVYTQHDNNGEPKEEWYKWRDEGFQDKLAHRYPMGKGVVPLYSWWDGIKYMYVEARKNIYVPLYRDNVQHTITYSYLRREYTSGTLLAIRDFDVYTEEYEVALNNPNKKFGHGFILKKMLEDGI